MRVWMELMESAGGSGGPAPGLGGARGCLGRRVWFDGPSSELADARLDACVLWVAHTYCFGEFEVSPRLLISGPLKGSGKSTLLEQLSLLVSVGVSWVDPTDAVTFRVRVESSVTLLLD